MDTHTRVANPQLAARVVAFLNELLEYDRPAIAALIANRVPCNGRLADHPTVQVAAQHGGYHVGLLGILNGLCGVREDNWGLITAIFEDADSPTKNCDLLRFEVTSRGASSPDLKVGVSAPVAEGKG
jgi:hypothetical protein